MWIIEAKGIYILQTAAFKVFLRNKNYVFRKTDL